MQYLFLILLAILLILIVAVSMAVWHNWTIYLQFSEKTFLMELRAFGIRRKLFYRDFSQKSEQDTQDSNPAATSEKKKPEGRFAKRISEEKRRIYDPNNGGFQPGALREMISQYRDILHDFFGDLRHRIEIPLLSVSLDFGTGNPAHTGMLYGSIFSLTGILYPIGARYFKLAYPALDITPDFYEKRFNLNAKSIIKVRPAHIINAVFRQIWRQFLTYPYFKNSKKGSVKK